MTKPKRHRRTGAKHKPANTLSTLDDRRGLDPVRDWLARLPYRDYWETP